jgi:hypothetical protein
MVEALSQYQEGALNGIELGVLYRQVAGTRVSITKVYDQQLLPSEYIGQAQVNGDGTFEIHQTIQRLPYWHRARS